MVTIFRMLNDQIVDVVLRGRNTETLFTHIDHDRLTAGQFEDVRRNQTVVDYNVRLIQRLTSLERQQFWITWTRANEVNMTVAGLCHYVMI